MRKEPAIEFALVKIFTEEFATFEENFLFEKEVTNNFDFGFNINSEERLIIWNFKLEDSCEGKLFLKGNFSFIFMISPTSWQGLVNENKIILPKNLLAHFTMLAVGTIRGILFEKLSKYSTPLSNYILPLINVASTIEEDVEVQL